MSAPDYARALTEFWSAQGKAMLSAQEQAARAMTEGMKAVLSGQVPGMPDGGAELGSLNADLGQASESLMKLWSASSTLFSELSSGLQRGGGGGEDGVVEAVFGRIADPRQWMTGTSDMEEALTRMAEGPRLADLFDLERRTARVMQAWVQVRRRTLEHQAIVLDAWLRAGRRYSEEVAGHASADGQPIEGRRALALWTEVANRLLLETQRAEPFLASQREMIRAATELRMAQQDVVERLGAHFGVPTRTELDDVHRTLTEMRRELRRVRRALQLAQAAPAAAAPLPAPARVAAGRGRSPKRKVA